MASTTSSLCASRSTLSVCYHYIVSVPFEEYIFGIYLLEYLCRYLLLLDEAEEFEILRCRHSREHYAKYPIHAASIYWSIWVLKEFIVGILFPYR